MAESNKENKFKEILSNSSFELNQTEIWDNISDRLPKKKDNKPFAWLFFGLLLGAVSLGSVLWLNGLFEEGGKSEQYLVVEDALVEQDDLNDYSKEKDESVRTETLNDETRVGGIEKPQVTSNGNVNNIGIADLNSDRIAKTPTVNEKTTNDVAIKSILPLRQKEEKSLKQTEALITATHENFGEETTGSMLKEDKDHFYKQRTILTEVDKIKIIDYSELAYLSGNDLLDGRLTNAILVKNPIRKFRSFWNLRSGANIALASYSISDSEPSFLLESIEKETYSIGTQSDIRWNIEHRSGIAGIVGLSYRTDVRVYRDESIDRIIEQFPAEVDVINQSGFTETKLIDLERTNIYYNDIHIHRMHKSYDFQLGLSKQLINIGTFGLSGEALLKYNLSSSNKAYYFDNINGSIVSFVAEDEQPYRSRYGLSYQFAINLEFHKNHYSIGLSPYWTYRPLPMVINSAGYVLKHNNMGLQLSMSFKPFN